MYTTSKVANQTVLIQSTSVGSRVRVTIKATYPSWAAKGDI